MLESATAAPRIETRRLSTRPERVVVAGVVLVAASVAVQIAANLVDFGVYHYRYALVDPNDESSLFAWIAGLAVAFAACVCLLRSSRAGAEQRRYLAAGLLLAVLALENRIRFHEGTVHGPLVYVPLLGALFAALIVLSWRWPAAARRAVWAGLASLVFSLALHKLAPTLLAHYGYGPGDWPYEVKVSLKESGELAGWVLIATGLLAAAPGRRSLRG